MEERHRVAARVGRAEVLAHRQGRRARDAVLERVRHDLLLAGQVRNIKLDGVVLVIEVELPDEKFLGPILSLIEIAHLRRDCLADVADVGVKWLAAHCFLG